MQYVAKRTGMAILVAILVATVLASVPRIIPGDAATSILQQRATPELVAHVREEMDLDEPVPVQLANFLWNASHGDLGRDYFSDRTVTSMIRYALPHTIALALSGLFLACLIGLPLGVLAARKPSGFFSRITGVLSVSFITMPSYIAGLYLLILFAVIVPWFPAIATDSFSDPLDDVHHLVLPAFALALGWIGYLSRLVRASMIETMQENHIRTGYAYGVPERVIFYKHGLRNAIIPTVAVLGVGLGELLGGAVFVEVIFTRVGVGSLVIDSIETRNYPVVQGSVLVIVLLFVFANLLADLSYRHLDPRIRIDESVSA